MRVTQAWRISELGLATGALFFAASLTPSLVPRPAEAQGVLGGLSFALGYLVATVTVWLWRLLDLPEAGPDGRRRWRVALTVIALGITAAALARADDWQNATRRVMELPPVSTAHPVTLAGIAFLVSAALWTLGNAFGLVARRAGLVLARVLPGHAGPVLGVGFGALLFWTLIEGVLVERLMEAADASYAAGEAVFDPEASAPPAPDMSGGARSLVAWDELGNRGRDFIARTPTAAEIGRYWGEGAQRPVRVYVGRVASDDPRARAELALRELIRQDGFAREVLVVATPVGTGWMDHGAHDTLDYMWGGDTAHVAVQYSYLTSALSILTNADYGLDQARALFDAIYGHWSDLPEAERPRLYVFGLSQGALNSQTAFPLLDVLADPPSGALWAGSPFLAPIWQDVRRGRQPGSPAWRPRFGNGSLVRVTNQMDALEAPGFAPWGPIRLVFLNYGSDPIVQFDTATFWRAPPWLTGARAPDVAPEMRWFPLVTAFQLALDMTIANAREGYGHQYAPWDYIDAWAALTDPPRWTADRAARLKAMFGAPPGAR